MPDGWTDHDYELSNRYGDNEKQELMAKLISEFTLEIKRGDPSVWKKLNKAYLDITGIDTNVDTILNLAKRKIIKLANSENDPQQRRNIFCEKANKFILEVFDYIRPTSVKMSDYVPPVERDYSSKKYHPKVLCKDVLKGKKSKQVKMKHSVNKAKRQNNETSPEVLTEPGCSYTGEPEESEHNKNTPLKKPKLLEEINPKLKKNVNHSNNTNIKTSNKSVSKPSTSKEAIGEELNFESYFAGDNAGPSSVSMEACDDASISQNIKRQTKERGINSSLKSQIPFADPSTSSDEPIRVPTRQASKDSGVPKAFHLIPRNRLRKRDIKIPQVVKRIDNAILGEEFDPTGCSAEHYYTNISDQLKPYWFSTYLKQYHMRDMWRVQEIMRRHKEDMEVAYEEYKEQKKLVDDLLMTKYRRS